MRPSSNFCILSMCVAETEAGTKYSSIRTQFVKSKNKLEQATRSRAGATTVKLWKYHNLCLFLRDHVDVAPQVDSIPLAASVNDPHQHSDTLTHDQTLTEQVNTFQSATNVIFLPQLFKHAQFLQNRD